MSVYENAKNLIEEVKTLNDKVIIVAASKMQTIDKILEAKEAGIEYFAENRAQEFRDKEPLIEVKWHFIGSLQTNKAKYVVGKVLLIHSVDNIKLIDEINRLAENKGIIQNILLEVNVGEEESKSGASLKDFDNLYTYALKQKNILVCGLMSVMPKGADVKLYLIIKNLYDKIRKTNDNIQYLSVGMSGDYVVAIKNGANIIRIGTKIFGERNYSEVKK